MACIESRVPQYPKNIPVDSHMVAALLSHIRYHRVLISLTHGVKREEMNNSMQCGAHPLVKKERDFVKGGAF